MVDVHAPLEGIHTWKAFFIHIATISIGLLIAIGLEQTVETLHHRGQLNELHTSLRQDAQKAIEDSGNMVTLENRHLDWLKARALQIRTALDFHMPLASPPPIGARATADVPDSPAWQAAKSSGLLSLMPQEEIKVYGEVDFLLNEIATTYQAGRIANQKRHDFEYEYEKDGIVDLSSARPEDLRRYLTLIMDERGATEQFQHWCAEIGEVEKTILDGQLKLENIRAAEHSVSVLGQAKAPPTSGTEHP
jgi:hypothetical protein